MKGFEVCPHTCAPAGHCVNHSRTPLWRIEGGALRRHLKKQLHPGCSTSCPAYGITEFHGYKRVIATPVQLQVHIPVIRRLRSISDDVISRSLAINVSELARQFRVDTNGDAIQAQRYMNEDEHDNTTKGKNVYIPGQCYMEGLVIDHDQPDQLDDDHSEQIRIDNSPCREVDRNINNIKNPSQPAFPHSAHSIGSEVSALSQDTQFSELLATPHVLRTIKKQPLRSTFRVLYVPDPSSHVPNVSDTTVDLSFTTRTITKKQFQYAFSVFPELISLPSEDCLQGQDVVKARLSEWVRYCLNHQTTNASDGMYFHGSFGS